MAACGGSQNAQLGRKLVLISAAIPKVFGGTMLTCVICAHGNGRYLHSFVMNRSTKGRGYKLDWLACFLWCMNQVCWKYLKLPTTVSEQLCRSHDLVSQAIVFTHFKKQFQIGVLSLQAKLKSWHHPDSGDLHLWEEILLC